VFSKICTLIRNTHNLSRKELGDILEMTEQAIGQYENNKRDPSLHSLIKMGDRFKISIDSLLGRENSEYKTAVIMIDKIHMLVENYDFTLKEFADDIQEPYREVKLTLGYEKIPDKKLIDAICFKYGLKSSYFYNDHVDTEDKRYEKLLKFYLKEENFDYLELAINIKDNFPDPKVVLDLLNLAKRLAGGK